MDLMSKLARHCPTPVHGANFDWRLFGPGAYVQTGCAWVAVEVAWPAERARDWAAPWYLGTVWRARACVQYWQLVTWCCIVKSRPCVT